MKLLSSFIISLLVLSYSVQAKSFSPIDAKATKETQALFRNLKQISKTHTLFGHQHATEYGHGWSGDTDRSDVKSVCGSHPASEGCRWKPCSGYLQAIPRIRWRLVLVGKIALHNR